MSLFCNSRVDFLGYQCINSVTMADKPDNEQKHPGGRPLKYETVEKLDQAIRAYFDSCDPHTERRVVDCGINEKGETIWREREVMTEQKPYTMSGLARALGISRQTILDYSERDEFLDSLRAAKQRCEEYAESQLYGPYSNGAKFNLANNYSGKYQPWAEKQVLAGDPEAPLGNPMATLTAEQLRKLAEAQADDPDADTRDSA